MSGGGDATGELASKDQADRAERLEAEVAALRRRVVELETGGATARAPAPATPEQAASCTAARELLVESRALLLALCGDLPSVMFVKDVSGRYALINRRFVELFEAGAEDPFGKTDYELFPADVAARIRRVDEEIIANGSPHEYEGTIPTPLGLRTFRTLKFVVHDSRGALLGLVGISHDISDVKRLEAERDAVVAHLLDAQSAVIRALEAPLVPVARGVLVVPLVGPLDEERLGRVEEALLAGASERQATFVILDMTGARMTKPGVVARLIRLIQGARLLGARAVVTGLRAHVARELATADVTLDDLVTLGTLEQGIAYALRRRAEDRARS